MRLFGYGSRFKKVKIVYELQNNEVDLYQRAFYVFKFTLHITLISSAIGYESIKYRNGLYGILLDTTHFKSLERRRLSNIFSNVV